jgi:hypothetical protein
MAVGIKAYLSEYTRIIGSAASAIDSSVVVTANRLVGPLFSVRIVQICDDMEVSIRLLAVLLPFPCRYNDAQLQR